tara:strand:+ start:1015 stop:1761 length:747 start_codon:yes stop_codon:yes gene_type:complete
MKTTIVITGHNVHRFNKNKSIIFEYYDSLSEYIDKIVFIWNNQTEPIPHINPLNNVNLVTIKGPTNSIDNRHHLVYSEVNTESALVVDEDIVLDKQCIKDLITTWEKDKDYVVGLVERRYDMFGNYKKGQNILTIGQTMMYHKKYMKEYAKLRPKQSLKSHDDLVFQLMVHSINKKNCTKIARSRGVIRYLDDTGGVSLVTGWISQRTNAIREALKYFDMQSWPLLIYDKRYTILTLVFTIVILIVLH